MVWRGGFFRRRGVLVLVILSSNEFWVVFPKTFTTLLVCGGRVNRPRAYGKCSLTLSALAYVSAIDLWLATEKGMLVFLRLEGLVWSPRVLICRLSQRGVDSKPGYRERYVTRIFWNDETVGFRGKVATYLILQLGIVTAGWMIGCIGLPVPSSRKQQQQGITVYNITP